MFYAAYVVLSGLGKVDIGPTGFKPTVNVVGLTFETTSPPLSLSSFLIPRKNPWFPLPFSENSKPWMDVEGDLTFHVLVVDSLIILCYTFLVKQYVVVFNLPVW